MPGIMLAGSLVRPKGLQIVVVIQIKVWIEDIFIPPFAQIPDQRLIPNHSNTLSDIYFVSSKSAIDINCLINVFVRGCFAPIDDNGAVAVLSHDISTVRG